MNRLIVISGPANSGKMPLARKLLSEDSNLLLVHRDHLREVIGNPADEFHITMFMEALAESVLRCGYSPVICAWNLESADRTLWNLLANRCEVPLVWLDVTKPDVKAMIPPMEPTP